MNDTEISKAMRLAGELRIIRVTQILTAGRPPNEVVARIGFAAVMSAVLTRELNLAYEEAKANDPGEAEKVKQLGANPAFRAKCLDIVMGIFKDAAKDFAKMNDGGDEMKMALFQVEDDDVTGFVEERIKELAGMVAEHGPYGLR